MNFDIQKIRTGNASFYKTIVERLWPRLFKFCCIYTQDEEVAKDIVQEAFLSLWENRYKLSEETILITYLMVICRNKCYNFIRDKRNKTSTELTDDLIYLKANEYSLENKSSLLLETEDLHTAILNALSSLRPKTREIFYLRYYEGLVINEISQKTNLADKTVEYHLSRAIKELQNKLSPSDFLFILLFYQI